MVGDLIVRAQAFLEAEQAKPISENRGYGIIAPLLAFQMGFSAGESELIGYKHISEINKECETLMEDPHPPSILLCGGTGVGKTWLLSSMVQRFFVFLCDLTTPRALHAIPAFGMRMGYRRNTDLLRALNDYDETRPMDETYEFIRDLRVLIIDDFGTADAKGYTLGRLDDLIDYRIGRNLSTWIATNLSPQDLRKIPDLERIVSRLSDKRKCRTFVFGKDQKDRRKG